MAFIYNNTKTYLQAKQDFKTYRFTKNVEIVEFFEDEIIPLFVTKDTIIPMNLVRVVEVENDDVWWMFGTLRAAPEDVTVIFENANEAPDGILLKYRYKITITMRDRSAHTGIEPLTHYQDSDTPLTSRHWKAIRRAAFSYMKSAREKTFEEKSIDDFLSTTFHVWVRIERIDRGTTAPQLVASWGIGRELDNRYDHIINYTKPGVMMCDLWLDKN